MSAADDADDDDNDADDDVKRHDDGGDTADDDGDDGDDGDDAGRTDAGASADAGAVRWSITRGVVAVRVGPRPGAAPPCAGLVDAAGALLDTHGCAVVDATASAALSPALERWLVDEFLPAAIARGLLRLAVIAPESAIALRGIRRVLDAARQLGVDVLEHDDEAAARAWLAS